MRLLSGVAIISAAMVLTGCLSVPNCEEPEHYESAQGGKRIEAPDDLNDLADFKEMAIPEASPRPPRDRSAGCIDRPPTLRVDGEVEEQEEDEA